LNKGIFLHNRFEAVLLEANFIYYPAILTVTNILKSWNSNFLTFKLLFMITIASKPADYFGSIYQKAMKSQLKQIGSNLVALRKAKKEDVITVANAVDIAPGVLQGMESGNSDFQVKILFALCEYYGAELGSVLGKGELIAARVN
jgi:hypothetical protein